jgi:hypothetical protein
MLKHPHVLKKLHRVKASLANQSPKKIFSCIMCRARPTKRIRLWFASLSQSILIRSVRIVARRELGVCHMGIVSRIFSGTGTLAPFK